MNKLFFWFAAIKCIWYQQSHSASKIRFSGLCSAMCNQHQSPSLLKYKKKLHHNVLMTTELHRQFAFPSQNLMGLIWSTF